MLITSSLGEVRIDGAWSLLSSLSNIIGKSVKKAEKQDMMFAMCTYLHTYKYAYTYIYIYKTYIYRQQLHTDINYTHFLKNIFTYPNVINIHSYVAIYRILPSGSEYLLFINFRSDMR